jgi:hypothetical protein
MNINVFEWLQEWYQSQCDGDWEHQYGIVIKTVDNPGWYIKINLLETELENKAFNPVNIKKNSTNWCSCLIRDESFEATCGVANLAETLEIFRDWAASTSATPPPRK